MYEKNAEFSPQYCAEENICHSAPQTSCMAPSTLCMHDVYIHPYDLHTFQPRRERMMQQWQDDIATKGVRQLATVLILQGTDWERFQTHLYLWVLFVCHSAMVGMKGSCKQVPQHFPMPKKHLLRRRICSSDTENHLSDANMLALKHGK